VLQHLFNFGLKHFLKIKIWLVAIIFYRDALACLRSLRKVTADQVVEDACLVAHDVDKTAEIN
jgi:hypothetical protein